MKKFGSYWAGNGKYQDDLDVLNQYLVPPSGKASTVEGEAIRSASNITHEMFNNGGGNFKDNPARLNEYIDGIKVACSGMVGRIRAGVRQGVPSDWEKNGTVFDEMCDRVMEWMLEKNK